MKFHRVLFMLVLFGLLSACTALRVVTHSVSHDPVKAPAGNYELDPHHWSISFDVDHLGFARYVMRFNSATARLDFVPDAPEKSRVKAVIKTASLDSNSNELDALVTGSEFLDAAKYPEITFESATIVRTTPAEGNLAGNLTIKGITHPLILNVTFNGGAPNPLTGDPTLGFSATGSFNRSQWGLGKWYPAVGNEVRIRIEAEFVQTKNQ